MPHLCVMSREDVKTRVLWPASSLRSRASSISGLDAVAEHMTLNSLRLRGR